MCYETINLGTEANPQNTNLGSKSTPNEKSAFLKLFSEFKDIFAWSYNDLKTFDTQIIQHVIPVKTVPTEAKKNAPWIRTSSKERIE